MTALMKNGVAIKPSSRSLTCSRSVRPFTAVSQRRGRFVQPYRQPFVAKAAEEEEPAVAEDAAAAESETVVVDDDFSFNYSNAKKQNQYEASDVQAALDFFGDRGFDVPSSLPFEADIFTNRLGGEDAAFFDDYDNNDYYLSDPYASAGIPEAAPKVKRGGRQEAEEEADEGNEAAFRELEDAKLMAAAYDEMGFDEDDLEAADGEIPWNWDVAGSEARFLAPVAVEAEDEDSILGQVTEAQISTLQDVDEETREGMGIILDSEILNEIDAEDEDEALPEIPEGSLLSEADEAAIAEILAADDSADLSAYDYDLIEPVELDAAAELEDAAVEQYLAALKAVDVKAGGVSEEAIRAALGTEEPVKAEAVSGEIPTLDDLPATPDFAAKLLEEDKAFDAVLDLDYQEAAVQAQRRLSKNVAELDAIPAIEYSENMFPEGQDLQVFSNLIDATVDYLELEGDNARGEVAPRDADDMINMFDSINPELVNVPLTADLEGGEESGLVERILELNRVTKVVKGGKLMGFRCVCVVGNGNGKVGVGCQAGRDVGTAVKRALVDAKNNLVDVPLVGAGTIPHRVETWFKAAGVVMQPAREGTGCIAGGAVRSVLELAGVQNVLAKRLGSRSMLNNARATVKALQSLRTMEDYAAARDIPVEYMLS